MLSMHYVQQLTAEISVRYAFSPQTSFLQVKAIRIMKYNKTVVHIDDDPAILKIVERKLEQHGIPVLSVPSPLNAISVITQIGARVVLLDIDMPGKDGLTLLREIKRYDAGIQVIMCTGMVSLNTVLRATSLGAEACIFKPIHDLNEITAAVDRAFEKIDHWWIALHDWIDRREAFHAIQNEILTP